MPGYFEQIINFVAPIIAFVVIIWVLFRAFRPMMEGLGDFIQNLRGRVKENQSGTEKTISYE